MRLITSARPALGRGSRPRRRSRFAGARRAAARPAGHRRRLRRALPRRRAKTGRRRSDGRQGPGAVPGRLRLLPRHERRGHHHQARQATTARRWSASAPPPSTSRSAPAGCRWRSPGARRRARRSVYNHEEIERARGVRRLPRPRPGDPRRSPSTTSPRLEQRGASSAAASSSAPTARRATTSPAPAARCPAAGTPPTLEGRQRQAHLRGHADRPAADAGLLRRGAHARGQARHHRLPEEATRRPPSYGGFTLGSLGPVSEGLFAWLVGIGVPGRLRGLDRRPHRPRPRRESRRDRRRPSHDASDDRAHAATTATRSPTPGCRAAPAAPDRRRRAAEKRAERQVATLFGLSAVFALLFCVAYFVFDGRRQPRHDPRRRRLQRRARRYPRPRPAAASASAPSSGPAS